MSYFLQKFAFFGSKGAVLVTFCALCAAALRGAAGNAILLLPGQMGIAVS